MCRGFCYTDSMSKPEPTIQDVMNVLQDFMQMVSDRFDRLEERMDRLEARMDRLEARMDSIEDTSRSHTLAIKELTKRVVKLEQHFEGIDEDIQYLYKLIEELKKDIKAGVVSQQEVRSRLEEGEAIAKRLSMNARTA